MAHRKLFLVLYIFATCSSMWSADSQNLTRTDDHVVASPNGQIRFELIDRDPAQLRYRVTLGPGVVIEPSRIGIRLNGKNLADGAKLESIDHFERNDQYPTRGVHSI